MSIARFLRVLFVVYWVTLTFLLLVYNPFEWVPVDETLVEKNFGVGLDPHTATFLLLGALGFASRFERPWRLLGILVIYGGLTEILQGFTGRCPDWVDFAHNTLGLAYAALCWMLVRAIQAHSDGRQPGEREATERETPGRK